MGLFHGPDADAAEIARLQGELEKANRRLEEVAAYYRGELESARRRVEGESLRSQAAEVARRKRAEEQVAYLKGELEAARSEAENANRRHQELLQGLQDLEQQSERQTKVEVDRFREAAKAAWRTAEDEVARLDQELHALQRQVERHREERHQLERNLEQQEENRLVLLADHQRAVARLKWALKQSEERRHRIEADLEGLREQGGPAAGGEPAEAARPAPSAPDAEKGSGFFAKRRDGAHGAGNPVEVDGLDRVKLGAEAGGGDEDEAAWSGLSIAGSDDLSDEFLLMSADESLRTGSGTAPAAAPPRGSAGPGPARPGPAQAKSTRVEEVSDEEAETLIMELNVDERMDRFGVDQPLYSRPSLAAPEAEGYRGYWKWAAGVAAVAVLGVAAAWII